MTPISLRAFIALSLLPEIQDRLQQVLGTLQEHLPRAPVRWVPAHNIHITLKFLGDVSVDNVPIIQDILDCEAQRVAPFDLTFAGLGAYPNVHRPRVIWVGVQAPPVLSALQHSLELELAHLGYAAENRPFSPHLTLGRLGRTAGPQDVQRISQVIEGLKVGSLGSMHATAIHLYKSDLRPGGAVYTRLHHAGFDAEAGKMIT